MGATVAGGQFRRGGASLTSSLLRIHFTFFFTKLTKRILRVYIWYFLQNVLLWRIAWDSLNCGWASHTSSFMIIKHFFDKRIVITYYNDIWRLGTVRSVGGRARHLTPPSVLLHITITTAAAWPEQTVNFAMGIFGRQHLHCGKKLTTHKMFVKLAKKSVVQAFPDIWNW